MKKNRIRMAAAAMALITAAGIAAVPAAASDGRAFRAGDKADAAVTAGAHPERELNAQTINSQYLLPDSDTYYITEADISWMNDEELMLARNEFYARRGRKFVLKQIREYFERQGWYQGTIEPEAFSPDLFNRYEQANVDFIVAYENTRLKQREEKKKQKKEEVTILQEIGPSEEEDYSGVVDLYEESILGDWSEDEMTSNGVNIMASEIQSSEDIGYMYRDLDDDDHFELLIGTADSQIYGAGAVLEIYTLEDGVPVTAVSSSENSMFYVCGDNSIRRETIYDDGKWEIDFFDFIEGELVLNDVLIMDESRNAAEPWFVADNDDEFWEDADLTLNRIDEIPDSALKHISSKKASEMRGSHASEELELQPLD